MRSLRLASSLLLLIASAAAANASCSSKNDDSGSLGPAASGRGGTGGTGSIALTGGSTGTSGGTAGSSSGGTELAGASGASDQGVPACTTLGGLSNCGGTSVQATLRTVNMLLIIDKSGSMTDPLGDTDKWTAMKSAIGTALGQVATQMNFGLVMFPYAVFHTIPLDGCDTDCCDVPDGSAAVLVPIAPGTSSLDDISYQLAATSPGGGTPTAAALDSALDYFTNGDGAALTGEKYVLLATDGGPNCNTALTCAPDQCTTNLDGNCPETNCCSDPDTHDQCLDDTNVEAKLGALKQAGIKTFVVGLPGTQQYATYLDTFAQAGGDTDSTYYPVSQSDGVQGLVDVFESITTELVRSCTIALPEEPAKLDLVNVAVDCNVVSQDGSDGSGWDFDMTPDPTAVILHGPVCDMLQADGADRIDVLFGCPTVR